IALGAYHYLTGQPRQALEAFRPLAGNPEAAWCPLLLAVIGDELGEAAERDQALRAVPGTSPFRPLADLFQACLARGEKAELDPDALEGVLKKMPPFEQETACYCAGRFLERRGQTTAAARYLERCTAGIDGKNRVFPVLAGARLHALGNQPGK